MFDCTFERMNISFPRRVLHRLDAQARSVDETRSGFTDRMAVEERASSLAINSARPLRY